eukprot:1164524-Prorocentrum_minimum.AAC.2
MGGGQRTRLPASSISRIASWPVSCCSVSRRSLAASWLSRASPRAAASSRRAIDASAASLACGGKKRP